MRLLASDLACIRGGREVFAGLNLAVDSGEALAISGPNGAGKSSLLRLIAGLVHPTGGMLTIEGGDPELTVGEQSHYLGHLDALKPALSVHENLAFWAKFLGGGPSAVGLALAAVGLDRISTLPAAYLSAGQRRRLSIARLIAVKRPIWLLDEPTSALDATAQAVLATLMSQHRAGGGMILAAVHGPIGLEQPAELRLGSFSPSPLGGEGRGGGWGGHAPSVRQSHELNRATPTPDPSPQGGGEKKPSSSPGGDRP